METRKYVLTQTLSIFAGEALLSAAMVAIFALLGYYDRSVLLGAAAGAIIATVNHLLLTLGVLAAAGKAEKQDVKGGQATIQASYILRLVVLFIILFALVKSGLCNVISAVLPLAFTRPILSVGEFFRK